MDMESKHIYPDFTVYRHDKNLNVTTFYWHVQILLFFHATLKKQLAENWKERKLPKTKSNAIWHTSGWFNNKLWLKCSYFTYIKLYITYNPPLLDVIPTAIE